MEGAMKYKGDGEIKLMYDKLSREAAQHANGCSNAGGVRDFLSDVAKIFKELSKERAPITQLPQSATDLLKEIVESKHDMGGYAYWEELQDRARKIIQSI